MQYFFASIFVTVFLQQYSHGRFSLWYAKDCAMLLENTDKGNEGKEELMVTIREAAVEDAQDIYDLYLEVMNYDYPVKKMKEMIDVVSKDSGNYVFVAAKQDKVVGVAEVVIKYSIHKDSYLIINTLAVCSAYQGKGIGSQMLSYIEAFSRKKGLSSVTVGSQFKRVDAHHFYQNNGFEIVKEHKIFVKKVYSSGHS